MQGKPVLEGKKGHTRHILNAQLGGREMRKEESNNNKQGESTHTNTHILSFAMDAFVPFALAKRTLCSKRTALSLFCTLFSPRKTR